MIRIYDKDETSFDKLGLGSLDDTLAAVVVEELNGEYELEMEYPLSGRHFDKIKIQNIIFCKSNVNSDPQPFRIYSITKPIDGVVTINAEHISYDMNGILILPKRVENYVSVYIISDLEEDRYKEQWLSLTVDGNALDPDSDAIYIVKSEGDYYNNLYVWDYLRSIYEEVNSHAFPIASYGTKVTIGDEEGYQLGSIIAGINAATALPLKNPFTVYKGNDKENELKEEGFKISKPMSLRQVLGGSTESLLETFKGELSFDGFRVYLNNKRGVDRGITIRYGKNMTDLEHEEEGTSLYTGIFPFYSKAYSESFTSTSPVFQEAYIVDGAIAFTAGWLSTEIADADALTGGIPLKPIVEASRVLIGAVNEVVERYAPMIIKTEGDNEDKIVVFKKNKKATEDEPATLFDVWVDFDVVNDLEVVSNIYSSIDKTPETLMTPEFGMIYRVMDEEATELFSKNIIYVDSEIGFIVYDSDGFYHFAEDATKVSDSTPLPLIIPLYKISWNEVNEEWEKDLDNGKYYARPIKPSVSTESVEKYVYVDLQRHQVEDGSDTILQNGIIYVNETLKNRDVQNILSLDLTSDIDAIGGLNPEDVTRDHVFNKAEKYLEDNDLTKTKETITIAFAMLSDSAEYEHLKGLEIVEIGDEIGVVYENLGVNAKHRIIATEYDVLTDSYISIELGEKQKSISNNVVTSGDNVSTLKNDSEYTDKEYITKLIAENAEIINAEIQNAFIETLKVAKVDVTGLIEATSASIDSLIAKLLVAEDAEIKNALTAGALKVRGDIDVDSGHIKIKRRTDITITNVYTRDGEEAYSSTWLSDSFGGTSLIPNENTSYLIKSTGNYKNILVGWDSTNSSYYRLSQYIFEVDREGNLTAQSVNIEGGIITIGNDIFTVDRNGLVKSENIYIKDGYADKMDVGEMNVNEITVDEIFFTDSDVSLKRISEGNFESHEVNIMANGVIVNNVLTITITPTYSLYSNKVIKVSYTYKDALGNLYPGMINITLIAGAPNASADINLGPGTWFVENKFNRVFPTTFTESRINGSSDSLVIVINGQEYDIITGITANDNGPISIENELPSGDGMRNNYMVFVFREQS